MATLEYVKLGSTDLVVSQIGFGCEPIGGTDWGKVSDFDSVRSVRKALDLGVNFFDTADVYGLGYSEHILCKALGNARKEVVIATKFGVNWQLVRDTKRAKTFYDSSPAHIRKALEASLTRLKLECIPLYQIHWPDPNTSIADTMEELIRCKEAGKLLYIGCSNFSAGQVVQANQIHHLASVQTLYNLIDRRAEEEALPCCGMLEIGSIAYGPLAQGFLTGKYGLDAEFGDNDRRSRLAHFHGENLKRNLRLVERIKEVGQRYTKTPAQVALRWVLDNLQITCAIAGMKTPEQVEENVGALGWRLASEDRSLLCTVLEEDASLGKVRACRSPG